LYKIDENFGTNKVNEPELLKIVSDSLLEFKKLNAYITQKNKIFPDSLNIYTQPAVQFTEEQMATIKDLTKGLTYDQIFIVARDSAFKKDYKKARLLCDYILNEFPNQADARTLKGKTLAWEKNYKKAEVEFLNVIKRTPYYVGSYIALEDLYWWSHQDEKSIAIAKKAAENGIDNPDIQFKLAQAYKRLNNLDDATKIMDSILQIYPANEEYVTFKKSLK
jgi:tetratricopeptide (TPR) repeat protein